MESPVRSPKEALQRSVKVQTLNMPRTIFKDALRAWAYAVNGRIRGIAGGMSVGGEGRAGGFEGCERTRV